MFITAVFPDLALVVDMLFCLRVRGGWRGKVSAKRRHRVFNAWVVAVGLKRNRIKSSRHCRKSRRFLSCSDRAFAWRSLWAFCSRSLSKLRVSIRFSTIRLRYCVCPDIHRRKRLFWLLRLLAW